MKLLTITEGWVLLGIFAALMVGLVVRKLKTVGKETYLAADRKVSVFQGARSIAAAWIWAPAIFICSQQSFQLGVPGIFWFTAPNIICFFVYAPLAVHMRRQLPSGYTLPEYLAQRFQDFPPAHGAFLVLFIGYQLSAIVINSLAGGSLLHAISGVDLHLAIGAISFITLSYTLLNGLKASILTDVIHMMMVLVICFILVPCVLSAAGGWQTVRNGLGGVTGEHRSLFDPWIAFTMGIPMTLGLIAGPISDQMFWQRTFAVKQENIAKTFIYGGLLFGTVPIMLSMLGFVGAAMASSGSLPVPDPQLVGPQVVSALLPKYALYAFTIMAFAGLCSTMDSACCAVSSLGAIDIYRRYFNPEATDRQIIHASRFSMLLATVMGTAIALLIPKLLWLFLVYGAMASAGMFPTVFALCSKRLCGRAACLAVSLSMLIGFPYSVYANTKEDPVAIVAAAVVSAGVGLIVCLLNPRCERFMARNADVSSELNPAST